MQCPHHVHCFLSEWRLGAGLGAWSQAENSIRTRQCGLILQRIGKRWRVLKLDWMLPCPQWQHGNAELMQQLIFRTSLTHATGRAAIWHAALKTAAMLCIQPSSLLHELLQSDAGLCPAIAKRTDTNLAWHADKNYAKSDIVLYHASEMTAVDDCMRLRTT